MAAVIARSAWTGLAKRHVWLRLTTNSSLVMSPLKNVVRTLHTGFVEQAKDGADEHDDHERLKNVPETITVHFVTKDGVRKTVKAKETERVLYLAHRHGIEMEGACEASLACTTCHCYIEGGFFDSLPEATETEEDLLDMAPFLQENSRLGCQVFLTAALEGIEIRLPRATKNFYVDGHVPQPH